LVGLDTHTSAPTNLQGPVLMGTARNLREKLTEHRAEEIETPQILHAWLKTLDLIEALQPAKVVPGHLESGWDLDAKADLAHNRRYLDLFARKITNAPKKPSVNDLFQTFKDAFPQAGK